ncbi:MAG: lysophospholipid acyltransferase family protein [Patescibacteria group bacterium]|jgi:1-acyl-sn-glycerol-3-phosphate acyltransferase
MSKFLSHTLVPLAFSRVGKIEGLENIPAKGSVLFVPNHISYFDPVLLFSAVLEYTKRKIHFLATPKHWWFPGAKQIAQWSGTTFINESQKSEALDRMRSFLESGESAAIYPEGGRNDSPSLFRGKTGAARLALWTRTPIIPVGVNGPATRSVTKAWWYFIQKKSFTIRFGKPVPLDEFYSAPISKELLYAVTKKIMSAVSQLCGKPYPW